MSKEEFLLTIKPDVHMDEKFFLKIYGYSLYDVEFFNKVTNILLEQKNISAMRNYNKWLMNFKNVEKEEMKIAASWLVKRNEDRRNALLRKRAYIK